MKNIYHVLATFNGKMAGPIALATTIESAEMFGRAQAMGYTVRRERVSEDNYRKLLSAEFLVASTALENWKIHGIIR